MSSVMDDFRRTVKSAVGSRSLAGTATAAGLPRDAIGNVLKGHEPKLSRTAEICAALELEFYIGPPRDDAAVSLAAGDRRAWQERVVELAGPVTPGGFARTIQRSARDLVRLAVGLGRDPIPEELWPVLLAQRSDEPTARDIKGLPDRAQPVDVIELEAAAGDGNGEALERRKGWVWFRRGWLERRGLDPETCMVIGVRGDSMEPTIPDGSSILVDRASTEWVPPRILCVRSPEGLLVKRAAVSESGEPLMASDHPSWPPTPLPAGAEIVGRVRWMAHGLE